MESLPTAVVFQMTLNKKSDSIHKLRYKEKSYQLSIYSFTKTDLAKIYRVDGTAAMYVGSFADKGKEFDLHAKSMSIDAIKDIVKDNPFVAVLSVQKGTKENGAKRWVAVISLAYNDGNDLPKIKREAIRLYLEHSKTKKDAQVQKLYRWEATNLPKLTGKTGLTKIKLAAMNRATKYIINHFSLPSDKIHVTSTASRSNKRLGLHQAIRDDITTDGPNFSILNIHDATIDTLIHEIAHMIVNFKFKRTEVQQHGAEYCGVYAHLLSLFYKDLKEADVISSMKAYGLKVDKFIAPNKKFDFEFKLSSGKTAKEKKERK